jgi:hypothetical protein
VSELPEVVRPLAFLLGTWTGEGVGGVPGGAGPDFPYAEELVFGCDGSPWLSYSTRAVATDDGRWLHGETGWWRPQPAAADGTVPLEVVLTHPTGLTEVFIGAVRDSPVGPQVELATDVVARTPTAPAVTAEKRLYAVRAGKLMYAVDLAAGDSPLAAHLAAALDRAPD